MSASENDSDEARTRRLRAEIAAVLERLEDAQRRVSKRPSTSETIATRTSSPPPSMPPSSRARAK